MRRGLVALLVTVAAFGWSTPAHALTVGSSTSNGFTMHWSVDQFANTKIGWTFQPNSVQSISRWMRQDPNATKAAMGMLGASACSPIAPGLGTVVCNGIFGAWGGYIVDTFNNAAAMGLCVTIKTYIPLFGIFNPYSIHWDSPFPYVDGGSWCNLNRYNTPSPPYPPVPNPQGPRTPGGCTMDPTNPACNV